MADFIDVLVLIVVVVIPAIVLHEVAHGVTANWFGDSTARDQGRLTLNPIKHIDPIGSIIVPGLLFLAHVVGFMKSLTLFGWAKPVPVNFQGLRYPRLGMLVVAAAGPLVNIILAWVFILLYNFNFFPKIHYIFGWGILFNLTLAVFNLLPIPPLDGSRIVMSFLSPRMIQMYVRLEAFGFIIVVILLQLGLLQFLYPIISGLAGLLGMQL